MYSRNKFINNNKIIKIIIINVTQTKPLRVGDSQNEPFFFWQVKYTPNLVIFFLMAALDNMHNNHKTQFKTLLSLKPFPLIKPEY